MKAHILEKLNRLMVDAKKTPEHVHQDLGFAVSTVRRWLKGETSPDLDDLTVMVEYLGGSMDDLFAEVGKQELAAAQTIDYKGTDVLVTQYEARLEALREKHEMLQAHHEQVIKRRDEDHERSVRYLRDEIERLRSEKAKLIEEKDALSAENAATKAYMEAEIRKAKATASDIIGKKQAVYWVQAILNILLAAGWIIAMMTDSVV